VFYFTKDTFDPVSIPASFVSEIDIGAATDSLKCIRAVNETDRVVYIVFFTELR